MPLPRPTNDDDLRELKESALHLQSAFAALLRVIQKLELLAPGRAPAMRNRPPAPSRVPSPPGQPPAHPSPPRDLGTTAPPISDDDDTDDAPKRKRVDANLAEKSNRNLSRKPSHESVLEMLIGDMWLRWAGVAILGLGLFFLLKYAYDEGMLTPEALSLLFLFIGGGTLCLAEGMLLFGVPSARVVFITAGLVLQGTIMWAHDGHALFPPWMTLTGYGVTTLLLLGAAIQANSLTLAGFAGLCAAVGPIGTAMQHGLSAALVGYVGLVSAALLWAGWWKKWETLRIAGWTVCSTVLSLGFTHTPTAPTGWTAMACLAVLYGVFTIEALWSLRRYADRPPYSPCTLMHLNNIACFGVAVHLQASATPAWRMMFCMLAALGMLILAGRVKGLDLAPRMMRRSLRVDGAVFLAWLVPLRWDGYSVTIGWCVQAVLMAAICRRLFGPLPALYVVGLVFAAFAHLFMYDYADSELTDLWTIRYYFDYTWLTVLAAGLMMASCLVTVLLTGGRTTGPWERRMCTALCVLGCGQLLVVSATQTDPYWATAWWIGLSLLWCLGAIKFPVAAAGTICLTAATAGKYLLWDTFSTFFEEDWADLLDPMKNRAVAMGCLLVVLLIIGRATVRRLSPPMFRRLGGPGWVLAFTILAGGVCTWTGTFEILRAFAHEQVRARFAQPDLAFQAGLSIFWAANATVFLLVGLARMVQSLRIMAILLFGVTLLKVLVLDLTFLEATHRVVLFMALGVLMVGASLLYHWLSSRVLGAAPAK